MNRSAPAGGFSSTDEADDAGHLLRLTARVLQVPYVMIAVRDTSHVRCQAGFGIQPDPIPEAASMDALTLERGTPTVVNDLGTHPRFRDNPLVREANAHFYVGIPIPPAAEADAVASSGSAATLCVMDTTDRTWSEADADTLADLAHLAARLWFAHEAPPSAAPDPRADGAAPNDPPRTQPESADTILDHVSDAFYALDADWRFTYVNDRAETLLRTPRSHLLGRVVWDVFPEAADTAVYTHFHAAARTGSTARFRFFYPPFNIYVDVRAYPGEHGGLTVYFQDVTDEVRTKQALQHERDLLHGITHTSVTAITVVDVESGRIIFANPRAEQILGLTASDLTSRTYADPDWHITGFDGEPFPEEQLPFARILKRNGPVFGVEHAIEWPGGERRLLRINGAPLHRADGGIERIVFSIEDVTTRHLQQRAHRDERDLLRGILDTSITAVAVLDDEGRITFVNRHMETLFGRSRTDIIGSSYNDPGWNLLSDEGDPLERDEWPFRRVRAAGRAVQGMNHAFIDADGRMRWIAVNGAPLQSAPDSPYCYVFAMIEVTARKRVERRLRRSKAFRQSVLDAMPASIAVVDAEGIIIDVNARWRESAAGNRGPASLQSGAGLNYLAVCRAGAEAGDPYAKACLDGLQAVLNGETRHFELEYPCSPENDEAWFQLRATPLDDRGGAVIAHFDVTERRHTEKALHEREHFLAVTLKSIGDAVITTDVEGRIVQMNRVAADLTGVAPDAAAGMHVDDVLHLVDANTGQRVESPVGQVLEAGTPVELASNTALITQDGRRVRIADSAAPIRDEEAPLGVVIVFRDVTDEHERRAALHRHRLALEEAQSITKTGILTLDRAARTVTFSDEAAAVFDCEADRAYSLPAFWSRIYSDDLPEVFSAIQALLHRGERYDLEYRIAGTKGAVRWVRARGRAVRDEQGKVVQLFGTVTDVTQRKRRESAMHRFARLLNASVQEIYFFRADTLEFVQVSHGVTEQLGYSMDELRTMTPTDLKPMSRSEFETRVAPLRTREQETVTFRTTHRRKDGSTYPVDVRIQLSMEERPPVFTAIVNDITEHTVREAELLAAKEEAEEMNRLKTAFLANMSHEIRTPLTSIIGFAELIGANAEAADQFAPIIQSSGHRLLNTLNSVLDLAQLEADAFEVSPEPVDLGTTVRDVAAGFEVQAQEKDLDLTCRTPATPQKVRLDVGVLERVLTNLLSNAVKFTQAGGVQVEATVDRGTVEINVTDTGIGISPDFLPHVFDEFKQESSGDARTYEGNGLGLTITHRLVRLMNGTIAVESTPGEGTTFTVTLPRDGASAPCDQETPMGE